MLYELDSVDKRILFELDNNCRIADTRLARIVGKSKESVRYRIRKLKDDGIITGFISYVDVTKLGYEAQKLYLQTREKPRLMKEFVEHLTGRPDVFWLGTGDGAWNVGITLFTRNHAIFFRDKNEIFSRFRELVIEEQVGTVVETHVFGKKFLVDDSVREKPVQVLGIPQNVKIDAKDAKILGQMINNGRMQYTEIAANTGISPDSVRLRVRAMQKSGVISRNTVSCNYRRLGYEFYKTFFYFEGLLEKQEKRLYEIARKHPNVVNYLKVIAPWAVELEIAAENYHKYNEIINYFRKEFPDVLVKVDTTIQEMDAVFPSNKLPPI